MKIKKTKDRYNKDIIIDQHGFQVMMEWEKPYMEAIIKKLKPSGDVLEVGFGLGYSASEIQKYKIKSHTIIEDNSTILKDLEKWAKKQSHKVNIIKGTWQTTLKTLGKFDCIFFDDAPHDDHPDPDDTRLYGFYYQLLRKHVNKNARLSFYCEKPINETLAGAIKQEHYVKWSVDFFKIKKPLNCTYAPPPGGFYIPLLIFTGGTTNVKPETKEITVKPEITSIFATPIYIINYGNVDKELELIKQMSFAESDLNFNQSTEDTYILNKVEFSPLKEFLLINLKVYAQTVLESPEELYITQSWANRIKKGMILPEHIHQNSIVSGVLHLSKEEGLPSIQFSKPVFDSVILQRNKFNLFNSTCMNVSVKPGNLILFPSNVRHSVPINTHPKERYSLSFNTFAKTLGSEKDLTFVKF